MDGRGELWQLMPIRIEMKLLKTVIRSRHVDECDLNSLHKNYDERPSDCTELITVQLMNGCVDEQAD